MEDHTTGVEIQVCSHAGYHSHCHPWSHLQICCGTGSDYWVHRAGKKVMAIISGICTLKVHPKKPIWRCTTTLLTLKTATSFCATLLIWSITAVTFLTCFFFALLQLDAGGKTLIVGWPPSISHGVWDECVQVQTPWRKEFLHSETHIHLRPRATPSKPAQTIIGSDYANGHFQNGKPPQYALPLVCPFYFLHLDTLILLSDLV